MKWKPEEIVTLQCLAKDGLTGAEIGRIMDRSEGSVNSAAFRNKIGLDSGAGIMARAYLKEGGAILREDCGGAVGIRWAPAHRSAGSFPTPLCEAYLAHGFLTELRPNTYRAR